MKVVRESNSLRPSTRRVAKPHSATDRRLALLKRSGLFGEYTHGAKISRACTLGDLRQAYRLVYASFVRSGYIKPNSHEIRIRAFEATAETATFVAKAGDDVVAALSLVIDSDDLGLPADISFRPELDSMRARGVKLSETSNQAVSPILRKTAVTTNLMRCSLAQAMFEDRDLVIIAVSPSHKSFYELLGFTCRTNVRSYSDEVDDPVVMMSLDVEPFRHKRIASSPTRAFIREFLSFTNPFHARIQEWKQSAVQCFHDADLLRTLFVRESGLLARCTHAERQALRHRWGEGLFQEVIDAKQPASRYIPVREPDAHQKRAMAKPIDAHSSAAKSRRSAT